jgi:hypothetical protein
MSGFCARAERGRVIVGAMVGCGVDGSEPNNLEASAARADLARRFVELQEAQSAGWTSRATYVRRIIRALESEVVTTERIGWSLKTGRTPRRIDQPRIPAAPWERPAQ